MKEDMNLFEQMLDEYLPGTQHAGDTIKAIIIRKDNDFAYLDVSNKLEGRIRAYEVDDYNIGDEIEVQVIKSDDEFIIVSKFLLDRTKEFAKLNVGDVVTGTVLKQIKGGYTIKIGSNNAFLPFSLSGFPKNSNVENQKFQFLIKDKNNKNITLTRTDLVKKEAVEFLESKNVGDVIKGTIKEILDFGLIVDLGPLTGFIHISEISWKQVKDLDKLFTVGQEIESKIVEIEIDKNKIKLSLKQLTENPWNSIKEKYNIGDVFENPILNVFDFGLLIKLNDNDEGFMHISDISYRKFTNLTKQFNIGDSIKFKVISFNDEKERINLSAKAIFDDIWEKIDTLFEIDTILKAKVINIQDYGIFLKLDNELEVFIHRNEFSWDRNEEINFNLGDEIEFKLIKIDPLTKKLSGSIKQLSVSPWKEAAEKFKIGNKVNVEITDILENGLLVKLTERFKGLVPKREVSKENIKNLNEEFNVGDFVDAIIIDQSEEKKSIILSLKKLIENEEKEELEELLKIYGV